jgi:DNA invertase Pin-like site-specific DNA recombinase
MLIGYWRESQVEGAHAPEYYVKELMAYGVPAKNIYYDIESGGSETRKGLLAVIKILKTQNVQALVINDHTRLHRSVKIWAEITQVLRDRNVELIDLSKGSRPVDIESAGGRFTTFIEAAASQLYKDKHTEYSLKMHKVLRAKGRAQQAPFGYVLTDGRLHPNIQPYFDTGRSHWDVAQWLVERFIETGNTTQTCNESVQEFGYRTGYGVHPRSQRGLSGWLKNPVLRGHTAYFGWQASQKRRKPHQVPELKLNTHDALVSDEQWSAIQGIFCYPNRPKGKTHRLAGFTVCASCGGVMKRRSSTVTNVAGVPVLFEYLHCGNAYPRAGQLKTCDARKNHRYNLIEGQIIAALTTKAREISDLRVSNVSSTDRSENPKVAALLTEIEQLRLISGAEGLITQKEMQIAALQEASAQPSSVDLELAYRSYAAASDPGFWEEATPEERAFLFRTLVKSVAVESDGTCSASFFFDS